MNKNPDIIIIGAGAAGLSAAWHLEKAGFSPLILEARDRVGGRVHSVISEGGVPAELGAEFVHGLSDDIWSVIKRTKATAYEVSDDHLVIRNGKMRDEPDFWDQISKSIDVIKKHFRTKSDLSAQAALEQIPESELSQEKKKDLEGFIEGFHAADLKLISTKALIHEEKEADESSGSCSYRLMNGYDYLFKQMASELGTPVQLNTQVHKIEWSKNHVRVHHSQGVSSCRAILITLPIGVLKAGRVLFSPALGAKQNPLEHIEMGSVVKVMLHFNQNFFQDGKFADLAFAHTDNESFQTWWTARPLQTALVTAWSGGPKARQLAELSEEQIIEKALESFAKIFHLSNTEVRKSLIASYVHNWQRDPHSLGAYSYVNVDGYAIQRELAKPIEDTLFFAGEATQFSQGQIGTVDGAIATGKRAAEEMIRVGLK